MESTFIEKKYISKFNSKQFFWDLTKKKPNYLFYYWDHKKTCNTEKLFSHFDPSLALLLLAPEQGGILFSSPSYCELKAILGSPVQPFRQHTLFLTTGLFDFLTSSS